MVQIRHATTTGPIDEPQWNQDHTITGLAAIAESGSWADLVSIPAPIAGTTASFTTALQTKLDGIAAGATANQTDAFLLARANHTGTQAPATIAFAATARLLGRSTAGAGAGEELTAAQVRTLINVADGATANATDAALRDRSTHTGTQAPATIAFTSTARLLGRATAGAGAGEELTAAQVRTLINVADGATANATDAALRDRSTHTGTQAASTISDFVASARAQVEAMLTAGAGVTLTPSGSGATRQIEVGASGGGGSPPQIDIFTASGTWTKPAGAVMHDIYCIGGGGGGGAGRKGAAASVRCGGGGGGGGAFSFLTLPAAAVPASVSVTVGAGGTGGAPQTVVANGAPGTSGGATTFGSLVAAGGGGFGNGGTTNAGQAGAAGQGTTLGAAGGAASGTGGAGGGGLRAPLGGGGGGSGGGITTADVASSGGSSLAGTQTSTGLASNTGSGIAGGTAGNSGTSPADLTQNDWMGGSGGSGGGSSLTSGVNGGRGGDGANWGGGGGGGGAGVDALNNSGGGGDGGDGICVVITYF